MLRGLIAFALAAVAAASVLSGAAPRWLSEDARLAPRETATKQGVEILRFERSIVIDATGQWEETTRHSLRVDHSAGTGRAETGIPYTEGADRVLGTEAWLMRGGKTVETFRRSKWLDAASFDDATLYSAFRVLAIKTPLAAIGDVFGAEITVRRGNNAGQDQMVFSHQAPARLQRLQVRAGQGWEVRVQWLNGSGPTPTITVAGRERIWIWEIHDRAADAPEAWAPEQPSLRAALTVTPPPGVRLSGYPSLGSWAEVGAWLHQIQDPQCDRSSGLTQLARQLTAGRNDPWSKIEAITRHVQERRYIMAYRNDGLGFGYRPRKASEVLAADYGDCKDKSNLLRALLREVGFESRLVAAYLGDPDTVQPGWPSPTQFNHAILMIQVPEDADIPGAVFAPGWGRVLYFDSTARWIPAGRLPWQLQGGKGLICDGTAGGLVDFPRGGEDEEFKAVTKVELMLADNGHGRGQVEEILHGQLAAYGREWEFLHSEKERRAYWTTRLNAALPGVSLEQLTSAVDEDRWRQRRVVTFTTPVLGQKLGHGTLLLSLDVLTRDSLPSFSEPARQRELLARPIHLESEVSLRLPAGSTAELPKPRELRSSYGYYHGDYAMNDGRIAYRRLLTLHARRVPPAEYPAFRQFLLEVAKAERTAVIIRLK